MNSETKKLRPLKPVRKFLVETPMGASIFQKEILAFGPLFKPQFDLFLLA
jgi:hypothetical protein